MSRVAVVTDTTHYVSRELIERNEIHEVSLYVNWGTEQQQESALTDLDDFYDRLRTAAPLPTTSQPSIGDFLAVWEPLLEDGRDIVSIHISGGISGTVEAARQTVAQLEERGMTGRVEVVDSTTTAGGLGLVVLAAAAQARSGGDARACAQRALAARAALKIWFCADTLEYLRRGGRIGKAQAWLGGALKIKPILTLEEEITPVERVRTAGRAVERLVEYLRARHEDGADGWVVQHIQDPERAGVLVDRGREIFGTEPVFVSEVGAVLGAHVGPGLLGVGGIPRSLLE